MPEIIMNTGSFSISGDNGEIEKFPKDHFKEHFTIIFPVMPEDFLK